MIELTINKKLVYAAYGTSVAAAILNADIENFRTSAAMGAPRAPLCGMGICFECRVTINGVRHQRSCTILAENGMEVVTGD